LELAQAGRFSRGTIAAATFAHQQSGARASFDAYYRRDGERVHMMDALRERVTFSPHSFVTDASFNEFHLVLCRDVLLNYDSRLHVRACTVIHDSVKRLGFLVIGRGESMNRHPKRDAYERVGESNWYRRLV
jgi:chemotaxis protein methyltransferase CheR